MVYAYLFLIIISANNFFGLLPNGVRIPIDIGIMLIGLGLLYYVIRRRNIRPLSNFFTWYIFIYLALVMVQVSIASFKYSQSIIDGLMAARFQFYYLSFPLFVFALDDVEKIKKFMNILTFAAIILILLALINYFGPTIFSHHRAEGHGIRAGIVRAYIPGMDILVVAALWQFWRYLQENRLVTFSLFIFILIFSGILFRQSRAHIISVSLVIIIMLFGSRRFKTLMGTGVILLVLLIGLSFIKPDNLLFNAFQTAYTDLSEGGGTWKSRLMQIEDSLGVFFDSFLTGSGGLVIRGSWSDWGPLFHIAYRTDLGYWVWIKAFGFPGIILMLTVIFYFYWRALIGTRSIGNREANQIVQFATYYFTCILISMVTQTYFTSEQGIVLLCLSWALLINASEYRTHEVYESFEPSYRIINHNIIHKRYGL